LFELVLGWLYPEVYHFKIYAVSFRGRHNVILARKNATVTKKIQKDYCNEELFENTRKQTDILSENIKEWIDDLEFIFCNAYFTCLDRKKSHRH